jgi:hypothetical protein
MVAPGVNSRCTSPVPVNTDAGGVVTVPLPGFDWVPVAKRILLRMIAVLCCGCPGETSGSLVDLKKEMPADEQRWEQFRDIADLHIIFG